MTFGSAQLCTAFPRKIHHRDARATFHLPDELIPVFRLSIYSSSAAESRAAFLDNEHESVTVITIWRPSFSVFQIG